MRHRDVAILFSLNGLLKEVQQAKLGVELSALMENIVRAYNILVRS